MKNIKKYFVVAVAALLFATSCQDNAPNLGAPLSKTQIQYSVTQDLQVDAGGNTVILSNTTPGTVSMWDYGTGKSTRAQDTIHFPFEGDYVIKFSAVTGGGIVACDPITVRVTASNTSYISDPLFTTLAGGPNKSKTWVLDLDSNGVSKAFTSPLYFAGDDGTGKVCTPTSGGSCWTWYPAWSGNTWIAPKANLGSMTFSLIGGPYITVVQKALGSGNGTFNGTYTLDPSALTITYTDVTPLNVGRTDQIYSKATVVSMTDTTMQLALHNSGSAEFEIYNFISKEYGDNWVPPTPTAPKPDDGFNPTFASGELLNILTGGSSSGRFWVLDASGNPVDWVDAGRGWTTGASSSYNWGWSDDWVAAVQNSWIRFDTFGGQNYTRFQGGNTYTGTFTIDEANNLITLSSGNTLLQNSNSWMNPTTSSIKVVKGWSTDYTTKGIWFGTSYDPSKDEWLIFHYKLTD